MVLTNVAKMMITTRGFYDEVKSRRGLFDTSL